MAANSEQTAKTAKKPRGRPFAKGQSGNPNGRPTTSPEQKDALRAIRDLAPNAAMVLQQLMTDAQTPPAVRLRAVTEVLDRTYGKAILPVAMEDQQGDRLADIRAEIQRIREQVGPDD